MDRLIRNQKRGFFFRARNPYFKKKTKTKCSPRPSMENRVLFISEQPSMVISTIDALRIRRQHGRRFAPRDIRPGAAVSWIVLQHIESVNSPFEIFLATIVGGMGSSGNTLFPNMPPILCTINVTGTSQPPRGQTQLQKLLLLTISASF